MKTLPLLPDKDFFSMGEACQIAQVPSHTLRYWESRLGLPRPARRASGHRRFTRADLETILKVKEMMRERRMTLAGVRRTLLDRRKGRSAAQDGPQDGKISQESLKLLREIKTEVRALIEELGK